MRCHHMISGKMKAHLWYILICIPDLQCSILQHFKNVSVPVVDLSKAFLLLSGNR